MIDRADILSMEFLKKSEYTGSHGGMRYRLEGITEGEEKKLLVTVWPEPFNFLKTPPEKKMISTFPFAEEGILAAVKWMNERLTSDHDKWEHSWEHWSEYLKQ